ncbi:hypothetical protein WKY82_20235 [Gordonia malaquae]|uniref:hypothetical protein n=1 Tax=Gordonia malaquae TaxID=410332 RepID=UPI0030C79494
MTESQSQGMWTLRDATAAGRFPDERFPDPKSADDRTRSAAWSSRAWVILSPSGTVIAAQFGTVDQTIWDHPTFDTAAVLERARAALTGDSSDATDAALVECISVIETLTSDGETR